MDTMYRLLQPLFFRLDAEHAHEWVIGGLERVAQVRGVRAGLRARYAYAHPALRVECAGLVWANPVGLAAGFDKRGTLVPALAALGFGHLEVGTVTPRPQPGNPRPRLFRLPEDGALINRLGFNSPGMRVVARNLRAATAGRDGRAIPLGVNIGKNRDTPLEGAAADYVSAFAVLAPLADYVTINISSPNTPGLRRLHKRAALEELLAAVTAANARLARPRPLFLKISPDESLAGLATVVETATAAGIAGFIAGNTTLDRAGLRSPHRAEAGGLSGRPLAARARRTIAALYDATEGRVPIIGVGGVATAAGAYAHIRAGATLVQLYTGLIYAGPGVVRAITRGLVPLLQRDGFQHIAQAVGADRR